MKTKLKLLLSLIMNVSLVSAISVTASAEDPVQSLTLKGGYAEENSVTSVIASLEDEVNIAAYSITLNFDPESLEFVSAGNNSGYGNFYYNDISDDSVNLVWSDNQNRSLKGKIFTAKFKTKGDTAGLTVPVEVGYSVMGNEEMQEIPLDSSYCEITVLEKYMWGDANDDGVISISDVAAISKFNIDSEKYSLTREMLINSDTDKNNVINPKDSNAVFEYLKRKAKEKM